MVFRADTGNNRKIVNLPYNCLYDKLIKLVSVDNIIRNNHFYYFIKFMMLQQSKFKMKNRIYSSKKCSLHSENMY